MKYLPINSGGGRDGGRRDRRTPVRIAFSIAQYACQMRSGDETNEILANKFGGGRDGGRRDRRGKNEESESVLYMYDVYMWTELVPFVT